MKQMKVTNVVQFILRAAVYALAAHILVPLVGVGWAFVWVSLLAGVVGFLRGVYAQQSGPE